MKLMPGGQQCLIKTKRKYSVDEVFEIMKKANFDEKFGPVEFKKELIGGKSIVVPGLRKFTNIVKTSGKTIQVMQIKEEGLIGNIVGHVTEGALDTVKTIGLVAGLGGAKDNKEVMKTLAEEIEKLVEVKTGGCYTATCVYGSYDCPEVWMLRRYRDEVLANSRLGRGFTCVYYAVSPKLVALFGSKKWFNWLCKPCVDAVVEILRKKGVESSPYFDN